MPSLAQWPASIGRHAVGGCHVVRHQAAPQGVGLRRGLRYAPAASHWARWIQASVPGAWNAGQAVPPYDRRATRALGLRRGGMVAAFSGRTGRYAGENPGDGDRQEATSGGLTPLQGSQVAAEPGKILPFGTQDGRACAQADEHGP